MLAMKNFLADTSISASKDILPTGLEFIKQLLHHHETAIDNLKKAIQACKDNNTGTINFLMALIKDHETIACTLRKAY